MGVESVRRDFPMDLEVAHNADGTGRSAGEVASGKFLLSAERRSSLSPLLTQFPSSYWHLRTKMRLWRLGPSKQAKKKNVSKKDRVSKPKRVPRGGWSWQWLCW